MTAKTTKKEVTAKIKSFYSDGKTPSDLLSILDLGFRQQQNLKRLKTIFRYESAEQIYMLFKSVRELELQTYCDVLILDEKQNVIQAQNVTIGLLNRTIFHPREIFAPALSLRANAIILVHNHCCGDPSPSLKDIELTRRLKAAGKVVGVDLLEHVIIGRNSYYSFKDKRLISWREIGHSLDFDENEISQRILYPQKLL